jgi:signal transduction histidine kinase
VTLRSRLFATIVAAVLASTILTVVVSELLVRHRAHVQALHTLTSNAEVLAASPLRTAAAGNRARADRRALRNSGALGTVFALRGGSLTALRPLGAAQARAVLAAISNAPSTSGNAMVDGRQLLYAARTGKLGRIVLVRSARLGKGDAPPFAFPIVLVGVLGALLAALLAWLVARRVTRPLDQVAELASQLPRLHEPPTIARPAHAPAEVVALVDAFNEMARELVLARSAQRDFLLAASHELRSPISAILAHAEGVEDGAVEPVEASAVIVTEAHRLERLVRDLLDLARIDRREFDVVRERVELGDVAATLLDRYSARASELDVGLRVTGAAPIDAIVWADHERLIQAASNLIENALRVSPAGCEIELEIARGMLAISDRGPGLSDTERNRAFERFYLHRRRGDGGHGGAGLGLAIVGELMNAMGGEASVLQRRDGGTRFELRLPPASDSPPGIVSEVPPDEIPAP